MNRSADRRATVAGNRPADSSGASPADPSDPSPEAQQPRPADTLRISTDAPAPPTTPPVNRDLDRGGPRRGLPRSLIAALVVAVLVISGAVALNSVTGALDKLNPFRNGIVQQRTIDRSSPVVLKAINDLGDFRAASGYYQLVVDVEKDVHPVPSFLAGQRVLFIAAGTVEVGVNLRTLGTGAITVNSDRTSATIVLPTPTLSQPNLDLEHSYVYTQQRGLFDRIKDAVGGDATNQKQLYTLASQRLSQAAQRSDELITRGETNTRAMLEGLLRSLGFTSITVQFR